MRDFMKLQLLIRSNKCSVKAQRAELNIIGASGYLWVEVDQNGYFELDDKYSNHEISVYRLEPNVKVKDHELTNISYWTVAKDNEEVLLNIPSTSYEFRVKPRPGLFGHRDIRTLEPDTFIKSTNII